MKRFVTHPYAVLTFTALIWGANAVAGKLAVGHVSPMVLTMLRWLIAGLLLLPIARPHLERDWARIRQHKRLYLFLGTAGFTGFNALFYLALQFTSTIHVAIVQAAMPLFVFAGSFLLFRARVTSLQLAGFALTLIGVLVTTAHGEPSTLLHLVLNRGDVLALVAVGIFGLYTVIVTRRPPVHWSSNLLALCVVAFVASLPLLAVESAFGATRWPDAQGWSLVVFSAVMPSIVSQALYIRGIEMIGANRANLFTNATPIFAALLAVLLLGEPLFPYHLAALALVFAGIVLAERGKRSERIASHPKTPVSQDAA
ncbi:DMT family transporter [Aureimonas jatrophae]|uniref:Permease of the drug/metabolite transporter (DMT) superfamily n=1 Tax=Aureimonas jatrophae TaxID=1166073 RepID=A0A1H0CJM8_9HYPH|nr:DMT family transporter [Aureimonas jatrophae]MBB3949262.1 drug/metabolite transporter (DMT)-like permease [Aureimonas jatrophae]SDN58060.1 Permease of the drug/metabolite transporter (DMT) superfamily [Aureimonas jatrophae]